MQKEGQIHIPSGCAIAGIFCKDGRRVSGESMINSIRIMHDRSNGLGGGFAGYGIYPEHKDAYAFHVFYDSITAKEQVEDFLAHHFEIESLSKIPTRQTLGITDAPLIWRYFVYPLPRKLHDAQLDEREYVVRCVMNINAHIDGAYVFSSGKNMGVFKAVGYPKMSAGFINWKSTRATAGPLTAATPQIHRAGGVVPILLRCWITLLYITAKFRLMTQTAAVLRCMATAAT
jgi:glutamate synthase domain-containing protein 1